MLRLPMARFIRDFIRDEDGATAIEYGLIAALIAVALISTLGLFGDSLRALYAGGTGSAATVMANAAASIP